MGRNRHRKEIGEGGMRDELLIREKDHNSRVAFIKVVRKSTYLLVNFLHGSNAAMVKLAMMVMAKF